MKKHLQMMYALHMHRKPAQSKLTISYLNGFSVEYTHPPTICTSLDNLAYSGLGAYNITSLKLTLDRNTNSK